MVLQNHTEVLHVDEEGAVTIADGSLKYGDPVLKDHKHVSTEWLTTATFRTEDVTEVMAGDIVHQPEFLADPQKLLREFEKLWILRWDKHRDTPESTWTPFCQMVANTLPRPSTQMEYKPITLQQWKAAVKAKNARTSSGPDGVTREDLLRCPDAITEQILWILSEAEQGRPWPDSMMVGLISTLEKVEHANTPNQFRPICILSLCYRVWSSIRTKQLILWLSSHSPEGLFGNRAGCDASQLWWQLASQIESAIVDG